jgi:lipopolysaccharide/colanic/teichoic acid biosynthesis glycosyltransferase
MIQKIELGALPRRRLIVLCDLLTACAAIVAAFALRANLALEPGHLEALLVALPMAGLSAYPAFRLTGTDRVIWRHATLRDLAILAGAAMLASLGLVTGMFLWDRLASVPRAVPVIYWLVLTVGLCGSRLAYDLLLPRRPLPPEPRAWQPVLLVGGSGAGLVAQLVRMAPEAGWRPVGILDETMAIGRMIAGVPVLGRPSELRRVMSRLSIQGMRPRRVIVTAPRREIRDESMRLLQRQAYADGVAVLGLASLLRAGRVRHGRREAAPPDLLPMQAELEARRYPGLKRAVDVALSLAALIALAPLLGAITLLLRASLGSPVLFRQVRAGRRRSVFELYKFRTMRDTLDEDHQPVDDGLRTPWVGQLLRRTRLDELPQLWNVLIGDMSLVGPRPLLDRDLDAMPDGGRARSLLRPGITGWAQVHGGALLDAHDKLALDLWYIRHVSLALDLRIMLLTLRMLVRGEKVDAAAIARAKEELVPARPTAEPAPTAVGAPAGPALAKPPARRVA